MGKGGILKLRNNHITIVSNNIWLQRLLRITLGIILIYAGYAKLDHANVVAENLMLLQILPWKVINILAMWLLCFEIFAGILLITGIWLRALTSLVIGFCVICIGLIAYAIAQDLSLHCGCFVTSPTGDERNWVSLWTEVLILLSCIWLWSTTRTSFYK